MDQDHSVSPVPTEGQLSACACIGPMYDEPHCYCDMIGKGLPLNGPARTKAEAELKEALARIFGWGDEAEPIASPSPTPKAEYE